MLMGELQRRLHSRGMQPQVMQRNMVPLAEFMNGQQIPSEEEQIFAKLKKMCPKVVFQGNHVYLCSRLPGANGQATDANGNVR